MKAQQKQKSVPLVKERAQRKNVGNWMGPKKNTAGATKSYTIGKFMKEADSSIKQQKKRFQIREL